MGPSPSPVGRHSHFPISTNASESFFRLVPFTLTCTSLELKFDCWNDGHISIRIFRTNIEEEEGTISREH